ncbi:hypothetical protein [Alkalimonas mucilaginosa]|uniref:PEP-CTERM sorting domain-containing protein n=1 Tax=Alkalimonas mucilaginosa TaxID=3057676 RepID=A0ABU7JCT0_9GAMM|nr:hypothetical protein [Alkalimonas sp. MEB004]MEE2022975.1 hypothetical protein [Alkalimonas sp. MEB004]
MKALSGIAGFICLLSFGSIASPMAGPKACDLWDMQVTKVRAVGSDSWLELTPEVSALSCIGAFTGNNSSFYDPVKNHPDYYNLGFKNDGWMNYYGNQSPYWDTDGAFITSNDMLQDLQGLGPIDPGWVQMGKDDGQGFMPDSSRKGDKSYTYEQTVFSMSDCKDKNGLAETCVGGDAVSGNWLFSPPAVSPEELFDILGGTFFDQMAVVFKSSTAFAIYTFSITQFADIGLGPILPGEQKFEFAGTWDMSDTLINKGGQAAGLSNYTLYGRDPTGSFVVPAPATIGLIGVSLLLMRLFRRKNLHLSN